MIKCSKTAFEICCVSHHAICDVTFICDFERPRYFSKNQRARILYSLMFILNMITWMFIKFNPEEILFLFYSAYSCKVQFEFLSCFYVNMVLRSSLSFLMFHFWMFCFTILNLRVSQFHTLIYKLSIYINEKLWLLKVLMYFSFLIFTTNFSLYFMFIYGIAAQILSIFILIVQLVIAYDSIVIQIDRYLVPIFDKSRILLVLLGFIVPASLSLFFCIYNLVVFSTACSLYLFVNLAIFVVCILLIVITILQLNGYAAPVASFIFVAVIQVLTWSVLSSTSNSQCSATSDTDSNGNYFYRSIDTFIRNFLLLKYRHCSYGLLHLFSCLYH